MKMLTTPSGANAKATIVVCTNILQMKSQGDTDVKNGDYVVLERNLHYSMGGHIVYVEERLVTFSDILIERVRICDAINATSQESS